MTQNTVRQERLQFSQRLQEALNRNGYTPDSPTYLAREFNLRFSGKPVTVHACRKWLIGEAVPTQEKLRILADWLNVPKDWLRYGNDANMDSQIIQTDSSGLSLKDVAIMNSLKKLSVEQRELIHKVILHMAKGETAE